MNPVLRGSINSTTLAQAREEQKPWQKMFMKNLPEDMPNQLMQRILRVIGNLKGFKRTEGTKGKLLTFCTFEFESGEEILRATKFLKGVKVLDKVLELKTSDDTQSFLKEWMSIQREEWRKKLICKDSPLHTEPFSYKIIILVSGSNEAKEWQSLQKYLQRQDKAIEAKLQATVATINSELKKIVQEKAKQDERKEHPREKERDKKKKQWKEERDRKYSQKLDEWLAREKGKERQIKKEKEREKERERNRLKKLDWQMNIDSEEENKRVSRFLTAERRKMREKEYKLDLEKDEELHPPEPAFLIPNMPEEPAPQDFEEPPREPVVFTMEQEIIAPLPPVEENQSFSQPQVIMQVVEPETNNQNIIPAIQPAELMPIQEEAAEETKKAYEPNIPVIDYEQLRREQEEQRQREQEVKLKLIELYKQVPQSKEGLWSYEIDWNLLSKSMILEKKIRPWLAKKSIEYLSQVEESFITIIEKKLLGRSSPDKIVKVLKKLEMDAEQFVMKLWKEIIFQLIKVKNGIDC